MAAALEEEDGSEDLRAGSGWLKVRGLWHPLREDGEWRLIGRRRYWETVAEGWLLRESRTKGRQGAGPLASPEEQAHTSEVCRWNGSWGK